jgi:metal-responsive CopG/Arc/MetJ family transcriptional regulator
MSEASTSLVNLSSRSKGRKVQIHVELPEQLLKELKDVLPRLGYSTLSEFVREMARNAVREHTK